MLLLALILSGSFAISGFTGLKAIAGLTALVFLPFYLIFRIFNLSRAEKIIFSFFAGIIIFPSLAYWLGFILPFRISILAVSAALSILAYALRILYPQTKIMIYSGGTK